MNCPRCEGLLVVEPLPSEIAAVIEYSKQFGWVRCLNCGMCMDLFMYRRQQQREAVAA